MIWLWIYQQSGSSGVLLPFLAGACDAVSRLLSEKASTGEPSIPG